MKKRNLLMIAVFLSTMLTFVACGGRQTGGPTLEERAWQSIRGGALLIDVRSPQEFEGGHLEGALNIPYDELESSRAKLDPTLDRPIVLYCRTGRRADIAERTLRLMGYTNILNARSYQAMKAAKPPLPEGTDQG